MLTSMKLKIFLNSPFQISSEPLESICPPDWIPLRTGLYQFLTVDPGFQNISNYFCTRQGIGAAMARLYSIEAIQDIASLTMERAARISGIKFVGRKVSKEWQW